MVEDEEEIEVDEEGVPLLEEGEEPLLVGDFIQIGVSLKELIPENNGISFNITWDSLKKLSRLNKIKTKITDKSTVTDAIIAYGEVARLSFFRRRRK